MTVDEALMQAAALTQAGRQAEAEQIYRQVLASVPDHPVALARLAGIAITFGHGDAALRLAQRAVSVQASGETYTALGAVLRELGALDEARGAFEKALELAPHEPAAYCNVAMVLWQQKKLDQCRRAYERALELDASFAPALHGIMTAAGDAGDFEAAADAGRRAVALGWNTAQFWSDFAIALNDVGDLKGAIDAAEHAVALDPNSHTLHFNLAQFLLVDGLFERGWKEQEYRWGSQAFPSPVRDFGKPMWDGSAGDKTVLLHGEQGFGDAIMFARYVTMAAQRARVIVECQKEVVELLKTVEGAQQVVARGDELPPFDAHVPFLSLPLVFGTNLETMPATVPYLKADGEKVERWRQRLGDGGFKVGIAWAGSATHINDANRSMRFEQLGPLADVDAVRFYSLQKGARGADATGVQWLVDYTDELKDFTDSAALVENLDLVISVDTAVVHLAGALGKDVWTMLPFAPDWRWLASHRESSPWYPSMRLFRQTRPRDWDEVVRRVAAALRERVSSTM